jgi:hypothetical protein
MAPKLSDVITTAREYSLSENMLQITNLYHSEQNLTTKS